MKSYLSLPVSHVVILFCSNKHYRHTASIPILGIRAVYLICCTNMYLICWHISHQLESGPGSSYLSHVLCVICSCLDYCTLDNQLRKCRIISIDQKKQQQLWGLSEIDDAPHFKWSGKSFMRSCFVCGHLTQNKNKKEKKLWMTTSPFG